MSSLCHAPQGAGIPEHRGMDENLTSPEPGNVSSMTGSSLFEGKESVRQSVIGGKDLRFDMSIKVFVVFKRVQRKRIR